VSESLYENRGDVLSSPKTPSRRLNPTASAYTPPQQALPTFSPAHKDQTPVSEELQRAFREGMTLGRLSGWHDGYKEGFQKGRAVGKAEGKNL
jgi:flagellar biosynthesis/type III secretory pathway protein FliH